MHFHGCEASLVENRAPAYRTDLRRRRDEPPDAASICKPESTFTYFEATRYLKSRITLYDGVKNPQIG
jgi:hypothetical protein